MISVLESIRVASNKAWYYFIVDATDTKPSGEYPAGSGYQIADGSRAFETQTEIRYEYNNGEWTSVGQEPPPVLITKTVTENGTYTATDDEADGYSSVTVNVDTDISAEITVLGKYDDDGTLNFEYIANYHGLENITYGFLAYRNGEIETDMTIEAGIYNNIPLSANVQQFKLRDLGNGLYLRPYIKIGENGLYYGEQIYVKYSDLPDNSNNDS